MKITIKKKIKLFKKTEKDIHIVSDLFLNYFIKLTWHHDSYSNTPIHYNHEIVNVIQIQNSPLQSFFC
jgi:hypothetical protein